MKVFLYVLGFCFVLEGLLPMLAPDLWKRAVRFISRFPSEKIRYIGLESVVLGLVLVWAGCIAFLGKDLYVSMAAT